MDGRLCLYRTLLLLVVGASVCAQYVPANYPRYGYNQYFPYSEYASYSSGYGQYLPSGYGGIQFPWYAAGFPSPQVPSSCFPGCVATYTCASCGVKYPCTNCGGGQTVVIINATSSATSPPATMMPNPMPNPPMTSAMPPMPNPPMTSAMPPMPNPPMTSAMPPMPNPPMTSAMPPMPNPATTVPVPTVTSTVATTTTTTTKAPSPTVYYVYPSWCGGLCQTYYRPVSKSKCILFSWLGL